MPAFEHFFDAGNRFERANENAAGLTFSISHHIEALVHAVNEVDISAAGRSEQDPRALGITPRGVSSQVVEAEVGLGFNNHAGRLSMYQNRAEQIAC